MAAFTKAEFEIEAGMQPDTKVFKVHVGHSLAFSMKTKRGSKKVDGGGYPDHLTCADGPLQGLSGIPTGRSLPPHKKRAPDDAPLLRVCLQAQQANSLWVMHLGQVMESIQSVHGSQQGGVMGGVYFGFGILEFAEGLSKEVPGAHMVWSIP